MSEPCPPAFIRTAPPTDPGTPTAHSNPLIPAAAVRRASTGRATPPPAVTTPVVSTVAHVDRGGELGDAHRDARRNRQSATRRFEPRPIDEDR